MKNNRTNFSTQTKELIGKLSGYHCSFPECSQYTIGMTESDEKKKVSSIGVACHIYPATSNPKVARYDSKIPKDFLKSENNGIWMCQNHAKLIDDDDSSYTADLLFFWKKISEIKIQNSQRNTKNSKEIDFPLVSSIITPSNLLNIKIAEFTNTLFLAEIWGKDESFAIKELLIELSKNAFDHGKASDVTIHCNKHAIIFKYKGSKFNPLRELLEHKKKNGGAKMVEKFSEVFNNKIILKYDYANEFNELKITSWLNTKIQNIMEQLQPCSINLQNHRQISQEFTTIDSCEEVHILAPLHLSISDIGQISISNKLSKRKKKVYLYVSEASSILKSELLERYSGAVIVEYKNLE
ncbi:hypothetical protein EHQ47_19465 [Leptospira bourretii]|uniref:hypothetical protein n=1 Tax=Leptospira bourretii TaxID=2484962 RepID=UPI001091646C|nr:hypothetical protein [Leptospira bourretii]TGL17376.1 hypothetical protein EHQ47_19465 [Leptospira bourretii]